MSGCELLPCNILVRFRGTGGRLIRQAITSASVSPTDCEPPLVASATPIDAFRQSRTAK
ncbi:hypothetical protein RvY_14135 [Ramazzottius varieornatus]|uniref:Uncharacterized protein n=1 Tax=Ramazzottius varieornatus TaxID=947166 RepID=A0A1D1VU57_RAMVA|nr:hypothetical protein RvY_14135 [Ramazzottius varieornatus]